MSTGSPIIGKWASGQYEFLVKSDDTNADEIKVCLASSLTDNCANYGITTDANLTVGSWYYLSVVYDGSQATNGSRLKVYVNGRQKTLSFNGTIPASVPNSSADLEIGGNSALGQWSHGKIDDVRIYNYVLADWQIKEVYNNGNARFGN